MNDQSNQNNMSVVPDLNRPAYVTPIVRTMSETEVLSAFQVTAAGTTVWWSM